MSRSNQPNNRLLFWHLALAEQCCDPCEGVVVRWEEFVDSPSTQEHDDLGLKYSYQGDTVTLACADLGLRFERVKYNLVDDLLAQSEGGDKLAGWPNWAQNVEYPMCPRCKSQMILVFQIDSEDNIPFMFGDCGCAHITQCPEHKDVVAFGWACS